jgi:imidazole glycerol-phosphate synthase subunit HisH
MSAQPEILLVDAGTGNLHSVEHALLTLGAHVRRVSDPADLRLGGRIVLPGVGAFGKFMGGLQACDLIAALQSIKLLGDPLLGICVGMQALFEGSEEMGANAGLGILPGKVVRFPQAPGLKVPHTGWNQLSPQAGGGRLFIGLKPGDYAYFNHSYYCAPGDAGDASACTEYGIEFTSMVQHENIMGVQFHPEKSQGVGLCILKNFIGL